MTRSSHGSKPQSVLRNRWPTREESRHARQLLVSLPDDQRQVIELAYFKGLTQTEIAEKVGAPLGTVKGRQRLALTKMHRKLTSRPELTLTGADSLSRSAGALTGL